MRDRGGVLSIAVTVTSRHEQQPASTTPRTMLAGTVGGVGFEIAASANTRTSSVMLTTAVFVAAILRYVAVWRNGLKTMASGDAAGSHSTPIGAQFTAPASSRVVTMASTIMGTRAAPAPGRPRRAAASAR